MGDGDLTTVSVDAVFERFPASVRGAVVVRGADRDPHQVRLTEARVVEASAPAKPVLALGLGEVTVDVAPKGRVMIPFEVPFAELDPGWYAVRAEVEIDGHERLRGPEDPERRFCVQWPSGVVRRGGIEAGVRIKVPGSDGALIDRLVCGAESAAVHWRHAPGEPDGPEFPELKVGAPSRRLPVLTDEFEFGTGRRVTTVYPVLKEDRRLTFTLERRLRPGKPAQRGAWSVDLRLE